MTLPALLALLALFVLSGCQPSSTPAVPLRTLDAVVRLPERELAAGRRVAVRGVVTLFDPDWRLLAVQDGASGVIVELPEHAPTLRLGDVVDVSGATSVDDHLPAIVTASIRVVGPGSLPRPRPVSAPEVACGEGLYRRVEVEFSPAQGALGDGTHTARFVAPQPCGQLVVIGRLFRGHSPVGLVGRRLKVRGVPVPVYLPSGALDHVRLMFESEADADILDPVPVESPADGPAGAAALPELRSIAAVKSLSRSEASRGYPARLDGVVTALNPRYPGYFIQDDTAAMCVFLMPGQAAPPRPGERVRLSGRTEPGGFAPVVRQLSAEVLGRGPMPTPKRILPGDVFRGSEENQWVELEGVAAAIVPEGPANHLELFAGPRRLLVWFSEGDTPERLQPLIDAKISVRGVYTPLYSASARLLGFRLYTASPGDIRVLVPPPARSSPRTIASLSQFDMAGTPEHRIRVSGVVTYRDARGRIYLQDGSHSLRVVGIGNGDPPLHAQATAEGFLAPDSATPQLEQVRWLDVAPGRPMAAVPALPEALVSGEVDGRLVSVEGFLETRRTSGGELQLNVQAGRSRFTAVLEAPGSDRAFPALRPGALLRLSGVAASEQAGSAVRTGAARIWLREPADIVVVRPAPWWDLRRALYAAFGASLLLVCALAWAVRLRHAVVRQMALRSMLEKQLLDAQKLESLGRLAGGVAHDFNNYLTVILGYVSLLHEELPVGHSGREYLDTISDVGEKATSLTRQLLAFSRKQVLQPVPGDPNMMITEARAALLPLIGEQIRIVIRPGQVDRVCIDPAQFLQVLVNLAVNARDAMPDGGTLTFETDLRVVGARKAGTSDGPRAGRYVRISVSDTGSGMDAATEQRIFEPFFTTKERGRGTGLGLAVVFGIIKQSEGHIEVESELGKGTCFRIFLPVTEQAESKPAEAPGDPHERGSETILLVEDQEAVRTSVRRGLETFGYRVLAAETPREALTLLDDASVSIQLLLTDVVMPEMSGPALAAEAQKRRPGIRVLYMSGYPEEGLVGPGAVRGAIAYLQKPFTPSQAAAAVRRTLNVEPV